MRFERLWRYHPAFCRTDFLDVQAADDGFAGRQSLAGALADYERRRNAVVLPMYEFTTQLANLAEPPSSQMRQLLAALCGNQTEINRFLGTWTVPVQEFFTPENVRRILNTK